VKIRTPKSSAHTLINVIVIIFCVGVLGVLLLPSGIHRPTKAMAYRAACASHLKGIGMANHMFAEDHNGLFPQETSLTQGGSLEFTNARHTFKHFQVLLPYVRNVPTLVCPADKLRPRTEATNIYSNEGLSYFAVLNVSLKRPRMLLAGDRNLTTNANRLALPSGVYTVGTNADWSDGELHDGKGNAVFADGSVQQFMRQRLAKQLEAARTNHVISIP
jgi:prepilin-type processing-associated H-X9-DG protein